MNRLEKQFGIAAVLGCGMLFAGIASATVEVMNFDGMTNATYNGELVDNYYNGGCGTSYGGGPVDCGGPNYGVVWSDALVGGAPEYYGNTANPPSAPNVMFIVGYDVPGTTYMNVAAGFTTGFSFYYAAPYYGGTVDVYSGQNGTGSLLASLTLPTTAANCAGYSENYSCWDPIGVTFTGIAESVAFGGVADFIGYDNITIGSGTPVHGVPEPAALGMFGLGALLIGLFAGLRRRYD
ncbi:MAG: PEP-CTERM sorting domain-containing protein [Mycobacterium sp.]